MTHSDNIDVDFELAPPDRLHAHHRRQLSAMLDGELSPDQARFMLRRLQHDAELAACWERWQVCGDVLRGRGHALLPADFSQRVAAAIGAPPAAPAAVRAPARGRLARWGGGALAASVALVALFMARQMPEPAAPAVADGRAVALVEPSAALAPATPDPVPAPAPAAADAGDAAALLAVAAPAAAAVAEVPRRAASRGSTRSQAQRAAARRQEPAAAAAAQAQGQPAFAAAPAAVAPVLAPAPGDSLFGGLPEAASRPWPRAAVTGLSARQPFAAGYGLAQPEAFAPFEPRLGRLRAAPPASAEVERPGVREVPVEGTEPARPAAGPTG